MECFGSMLAYRQKAESNQTKRFHPTQQLETSVGTQNENPQSDVRYRAEKNSAESLGTMSDCPSLVDLDNEAGAGAGAGAGSGAGAGAGAEAEYETVKEEVEEERDQSPKASRYFTSLNETDFFTACKVDVPYPNQEINRLFLIPVDFTISQSGKWLPGQLDDNIIKRAKKRIKKEDRKRLNKDTPKIYYFKDFDRKSYERKRKTMRNRIPEQDLEKYLIHKAEIRIQLILYPECFLLVDPADSKRQYLMDHFGKDIKWLEIIQTKSFPENVDFERSYLKRKFDPEKSDKWFEIEDNLDSTIWPETGK